MVVSVLLGGGLLWLSLRKVDWPGALAAARNAELVYLIPYVVSLLVIHLVRTLRWGELLAPVDRVPFGRLLAVSSVGLAAIALLPLRLGEFVRPMLIRDGKKVRFGAALATVAAERVIDGLLVAALIAVLLVTLPSHAVGKPIDPTWAQVLRQWGIGFGAFFLVAFAVLIFAQRDRERFSRLAGKMLFFSRRLRTLVERTVATFADGLASLGNPYRLTVFMAYTLGYWALNGVGMWMLFRAFHLPMTVGASFAVMALIVVGIMIPGGPGMLGNFELFARWGMLIFLPVSLVDSTGLAYVLVLHTTQLIVQTLLAAVFLGSRHASMAGVADAIRRTVSGNIDANGAG